MQDSQRITVNKAAKRIGESASKTMRRVQNGTLVAEVISGDRPTYLVDVEDVEKIRAERIEAMRKELATVEAAS